MKDFKFIFLLLLLGCNNPKMSELEKLAEKRIESEEEFMDNNSKGGIYIDYSDNLENELRGTETELTRMNKVNDSLLKELYKCQNQ